MVYHGHIENGVVVFEEPVSWPDGTGVRVEVASLDTTAFWQRCTIADLAARQSVLVAESTNDQVGGWPDDELDDRFEDALADWRRRETEQCR